MKKKWRLQTGCCFHNCKVKLMWEKCCFLQAKLYIGGREEKNPSHPFCWVASAAFQKEMFALKWLGHNLISHDQLCSLNTPGGAWFWYFTQSCTEGHARIFQNTFTNLDNIFTIFRTLIYPKDLTVRGVLGSSIPTRIFSFNLHSQEILDGTLGRG